MRERIGAVQAWIGIDQAEIGRRLGEDAEWVSSRLKEPRPGGRKNTSIVADDVERFARALRVPPGVLVDDEELEQFIRGAKASDVFEPVNVILDRAEREAERRQRAASDGEPAEALAAPRIPAAGPLVLRDLLKQRYGLDDDAVDEMLRMAELLGRRRTE